MKKIFTSNSTSRYIIFWMVVCSALISNPAQANNIRINAPVKVSAGTGDTLVLEFPLQWDNSWRDEFNWDAAWVFLKYKVGTGDWKHVPLSFGGHSFNGSSGQPVHFDYMSGQTGSNTLGLFVYRSRSESGNTPEIICKLKCLKSALGGMTPEKFDDHEAFIRAQAIEMAYVSYGAYYLGDGGCDNRFAGASDGSAVLIDNEDAISASTATKLYVVSNGTVGAAQTIAATYPKGYKGFYTMKYELSQEQYVAFLNTLTYTQQKERIPGLASMKEGDYIFGDRTQPSNRNGICVAVASFNDQPVIFANDLTNDGKYAQDNDGKTIACNYLSPNDMLGYCSWSGLRPMSEMEYEKACRPVYPETALLKGYAWNTATVPGRLSAVSNGGQRNEVSGSSGANVNAGNGFGPVRCGLFATSASNQQTAGATFWGAMEMSGNLRELCYNIGAASTFNGTVLGDGTYAVNKWNNTVANFGVRGGSFTSGDDLLRVSDRTEAKGYFTSLEQHDSTVTFRGVYPVAGAVDAGTIEVMTVCPDNIEIKSSKDASCKFNLSYLWYVQKPGATVWEMMPGETGAAISNYVITEDFGTVASKVYKFKRKAVALAGEATTAEISLTIPNMKFSLNNNHLILGSCNYPRQVVPISYCTNPNFSWLNGSGGIINTGNSFTISQEDFSVSSSPYSFTCMMDIQGCQVTRPFQVSVVNIQKKPASQISKADCGHTIAIDERDGREYCTTLIGDMCWMGENMNVGTAINGTDITSANSTPGIQKGCYDNDTVNCNKYGGIYNRYEASYGGNTGGYKYVNGNTSLIQGICPDGWHVSLSSEWQAMVNILGTGSGRKLKAATDWSNIPGTNEYGFNGLPGGMWNFSYQKFTNIGTNGSWWTAPSRIDWNLHAGTEATIDTGWGDINGFSCRCVLN